MCSAWGQSRPQSTLPHSTNLLRNEAGSQPQARTDCCFVFAASVITDQLALTANTGGRRVAAVCQLAPASADAKRSPEVAPK